MGEARQDENQQAPEATRLDLAERRAEFWKEVSINIATKIDIQNVEKHLNKRIDDVQKWIWFVVIPFLVAILGLVIAFRS